MTMSRSRSPEVQGSRGTLVPQHPEVRPEPQTQGLIPSRTYRAVQTPRRWTCDRYSVLTSGDSPGDEVTQDIIWDPTSPTQPGRGEFSSTTRMVKISDIVNRIAPKDVRPAPSPLLQWMGDCGVSCTPEPRTHRARRRSVRQSSVDGLVELARAFDRNMERSDNLSAAPRLPSDLATAPRPHGDQAAAPRPHGDLADDPRPNSNLAATPPPLPPPSESQRVEAELRELFDSSTQGVSGALSQGALSEGPLSQGFSRPLRQGVSGPLSQGALSQGAPSQGVSGPQSQGSDRPPGSAVRGPGPVVQDYEDDFEDDWEDDDLMNDPLVVATTSAAPPGVDSSSPPRGRSPRPRGGRPGPRTPQRSTFRLEPNPRCLAPPASTNHKSALLPPPASTNHGSERLAPPALTNHRSERLHAVQPVKMQPVTTVTPLTMVTPVTKVKPVTTVKPQSSTAVQGPGAPVSRAVLAPGAPDSWWDEGGDDQLLLQVCEDVEKFSNSQPSPAPQAPPLGRGHPSMPARARGLSTTPVAIAPAPLQGVGPPLACGYRRSNSAPVAGGRAASVQTKGAGVTADQSALSQSHPGSHVGPRPFSHLRDAPGTFRPQTVTSRPSGNSHHATFKRPFSDSAISSNAVSTGQVSVQLISRCSAADIERKKQEALARKRKRMQNPQKHQTS